MARPKLDWDNIEKLVVIGLMPFEICEIIGRSLPFDQVSILYKKHWSSFIVLNRRYKKRISRIHGIGSDRSKELNKLRSTIKSHIASIIIREMGPIEEIIGYKIEDLYNHLNNNLKDGMSWEERSKWHIDHIKPASSFSSKQIKECFSLDNLRPLWASDNLKKGNKYA